MDIYENNLVVPSFRPSVRGPCEHDRDYTVASFFVKLGRHINHDEMMDPINSGGHNEHIWKYACEQDRDETVVCFFIKLSRHVSHGERMDPIDFGGQMSRSQLTYMEISL